MDKILIHGGHPLSGSIKISGSKNSALPILAATLADARAVHPPSRARPERHALHAANPDASRRGSGTRQRHGDGHGGESRTRSRPTMSCGKMRASVCVIGPLLRPMQGSDRFVARRLRHRRSADRFALERLRSARRGGAGGRRQRQSFRPETDRRGRSICAANLGRLFSAPITS